MMFRPRALLAVVTVAALTLLISHAARCDDQFEPVRQRITKALTDSNLPSIAVAVARNGEIIMRNL